MRRVGGILVCLVALLVIGQTTRTQGQARPNVVLLMVDDLNVSTLDRMVAAGMMPNVKANLVDVGVRFNESFVTRSLGVPSRATSLTGLYAHNHGVLGHLNETNGGITRFNASSTIATWLRGGGYLTGYVGKYLSGYGTYTATTYVPPGWDFWAATLEPFYHSMDQYALNLNGSVIDFAPLNEENDGLFYQTDVLTILAGAFVTSAQPVGKPFFLYLAPAAMNMEFPFDNECPDASAPLWGGNFWGATGRPPARFRDTIYGNTTDFALPQPPSFNEADVSDKPLWLQNTPELTPTDVDCLQRNYWRRLEMLRAVDDMVGYLFQKLQATGALANTVVILTSDNGLYLGEHRLGEKSSAYEESIRVPLYIRVPWSTTPRTVSQIALNNDLAPTIAAFASVKPGLTPDGRSLLPVLQNPSLTNWRKIFLVEHWWEADSVSATAPTQFAVRTHAVGPRLFVTHPTETSGITRELYDLSSDPNQLTNVAASRPGESAFLEWLMSGLKTCRGASCVFIENLLQ